MSEIALIPGGSGTLGTMVAKRLASRGYRIVLAGRDEDKLHASPIDDTLKVAGDLSRPENV